MHFDGAEVRTHFGTILIGRSSDPDISFWRKALGQDRLSFLVSSRLQQGEYATTVQLRHLLQRLGILSYAFRVSDRTVIQTVLRAIDTGQVAAVFLTDDLAHRSTELIITSAMAVPRKAIDLARIIHVWAGGCSLTY